MALIVAQLTNQIQSVFDAQLESPRKIASKLTRAYTSYARAAQAPPGAPVILKGAEGVLFEQALVSLMEGQMPAPQAAKAIADAITGFWLTPPVQTGAGGVATTIITPAAMAKIASINVDSSSKSAQSLASSLDLMTKTVFVVNPFPLPPGPLF